MTTNRIAAQDGRTILDGFVVFKLFSADTGGALAMVEHTLAPGTLGAPVHTHRDEDEYSYVLEGELTVLIGDQVVHAPAGTLVCKPRSTPHTFWNGGATPVRLLEIIAPGGFEEYFDELAEVLGSGPPDPGHLTAVAQKYNVAMDFSSVAELGKRYGVWLGGPRAANGG